MAVEFINAVYALPPGSVSATEVAVLAYLANRANAEGRCWPKRSTIAAACQLHPDTVKAVLGALADRGLIGKRNRIVDGRIVSADVVLLFDPVHLDRRGSGAEPRSGGCTATGGGGSRTPNKNHQGNTPDSEPTGSSRADASARGDDDQAPKPAKKSRKKKATPPLDVEAFERFWELYPRKVAKKPAQDAFARACARITGPEPPAEVMIAALARVIPIWQRRDIENVPHATTWLNQDRWNDEHSNPSGPGGPGSPSPYSGRPRSDRDARVEQMLAGAVAALDRGGG